MEPDSSVTEARDSFQGFVTQHTDPDIDDSGVYLETLLAQWLYMGMGIEDTAADYDHFLQVVLAIADGVMQRTLSLDYSGPDTAPYRRYISGLVDPKRGNSVLTRIGYDQLVGQTQEGRRSEELQQRIAATRTKPPEQQVTS
ncbi:hypothetical protein [Actinacidiphila sp. ITFR-21]|uniref:hypothetical protein n=1 Tax=Actinacidiphila sp. ITFR-21 TaxID=3075199 RepID=UPI002889D6AA|nr:hypothetical protein [Streptomyces sp. ITFR-21]WNI14693.1 hypothetical protein RLT57_03445 [Streptomyces sp. ITFR-21]